MDIRGGLLAHFSKPLDGSTDESSRSKTARRARPVPAGQRQRRQALAPQYHLAGRERLRALGEYPDVTLTVARQKAGEARNLVRDGLDPVQAAREQKATSANAALQTFAVVADEWMAKKAKKWTDGHLEQNRQSLRVYVLPKIGARAVASLTAQDVMRVLEPLEAAGKLETLRRIR